MTILDTVQSELGKNLIIETKLRKNFCSLIEVWCYSWSYFSTTLTTNQISDIFFIFFILGFSYPGNYDLILNNNIDNINYKPNSNDNYKSTLSHIFNKIFNKISKSQITCNPIILKTTEQNSFYNTSILGNIRHLITSISSHK